MTDKYLKKSSLKKNLEKLDDCCEECKKRHESVYQNLILLGFKICSFCRTSKTIFPL